MVGFMKKAKKAISNFVSDVKEDGAEFSRAATSKVNYEELTHALKNPPKEFDLQQKKQFALRQCRQHIPHLTNKHAVLFFEMLDKERGDPALKYIRQESGYIQRLFGKYGNTATYKKIVGLLKAHINENYLRHTESDRRFIGDHLREEQEVQDVMHCQRGRLPNLYVYFGINNTKTETGKYNVLYDQRRTPPSP